jgi:hypothetical protein
MTSAEDTRAKWNGWCDRIGFNLLDLAVCTHIYKELTTIILANPLLVGTGSVYWLFLNLTYTHYALAAIRRQLKDGDDEVSLARLLRQLAANPSVVTRQWFVGEPPEELRALVLQTTNLFFDEFAGEGGDTVDPAVVHSDLAKMKAALATLEAVADRSVAHLDRRGPIDRPQPREVHEAVDVVLGMYQRYRTLACRGPWDFNIPQSVGEEWKELFKAPWIARRGVEE